MFYTNNHQETYLHQFRAGLVFALHKVDKIQYKSIQKGFIQAFYNKRVNSIWHIIREEILVLRLTKANK